jgi:hypothetical protein
MWFIRWALNRDQVARWADLFSRLNIDLPSDTAASGVCFRTSAASRIAASASALARRMP